MAGRIDQATGGAPPTPDARRGDRGDPRRRAAAVDVQPDHRCDRGDRRAWSWRCSSPCSPSSALPCTACSRRSAPRSCTLFAGVVAQARRRHARRVGRRRRRRPPPRRRHPGRVRSRSTPPAAACSSSVVLLLVAAVAGCAFSLRRVLADRPRRRDRHRLMSTSHHQDHQASDAPPPRAWRRPQDLRGGRRRGRRPRPRRPRGRQPTRSSPSIGPSGSGKTTLCSIAGGLLTATDGEVVVGGEDISGYASKQLTEFRRTTVGFVFQCGQPGAVPHRPGEPARGRRAGRRRRTGAARHGAGRSAARRARPGRSGRRTSRLSSPAASANASPSAGR